MPGWSGCDVCGLKLYGVDISIYLHDLSGERPPQLLPPGEYELVPVAVNEESGEPRWRPDGVRVVVSPLSDDERQQAEERGAARS